MNLTVQMQGLDQLSLKVSYLKNAARAGLKLGVSEAAGIFEAAAKENVPVKTGNLRDHIHIEQTVDQVELQQLAVSPTVEAGNKYGFEPPYARRVEYGFVGTDSLGRHYHQAAQPYMRPAFDDNIEAGREAITSGVYDQLDAAMATTAGKRL